MVKMRTSYIRIDSGQIQVRFLKLFLRVAQISLPVLLLQANRASISITTLPVNPPDFQPSFRLIEMAAAAINGIGLVLGVLTMVPFIITLIPPTPAELKTNIKVIVGSSGQAGGVDPHIHLCESFNRVGCQGTPKHTHTHTHTHTHPLG